MPSKKSFSSAEISQEEEDEPQRRNHGNRFEPEAEEEEVDDPQMKGGKRRGPDEDDEEEDEEEGRDEDGENEDDEEEVRREEEEEEEEEEEDEDEDGEGGEDSKERSPSLTSGEKSEFLDVDLADIRKDVQCPICLGIIKKTRTVMECLHRFCRECIDKSMRLGNNECPACRKHCASRRSLRDDPKFDALIAALFINIDKYEEEELAFHEDERARNKQIQASIAQISQRQSEALVKRRSFGKEAAVLSRPQRIGSGSRRRRNYRSAEHHMSEAHDDDNNDGGKDSSSDERCAEVRQRKRRRHPGNRSSHPSSSGVNNNNGNCADNDLEAYRESRGISPGLVWNPEILAWGRGGTRSNTRHGNVPGGSSKSVRNARLNRLVEYLRNLEGNSVELDIHLKLVSLDAQHMPPLQQPYLCCRPTLLVKQLREFVALQMHLKAEELELLAAKGESKQIESPSLATSCTSTDEMQSLEDDETLARLRVDCISSREYLIVAYRQKK